MPMNFSGPWFTQSANLQQLANNAMQGQAPIFFPGQQIAGLNPWNMAGINSLQGAAGQQSQLAGAGANAWQQALGMGGGFDRVDLEEADPARNPYVKRMLRQNRRQVNRNLQENLLPNINAGSISTGTGLGNSADALARGVAAGQTSEALADANAGVLSNAYNTNQARNLAKWQTQSGQNLAEWQTQMGGRNQALGMMPQMMGAMTMPGQTMSNIGDYLKGHQQQLINAAKQKWDFQQNAPWDLLNKQMGIVGPIGSMGQTGMMPSPDRGGSGLGQVLGGALALGGLFAPGGGNLASLFSGGGGGFVRPW